MDNFRFDVTCMGEDEFKRTLGLALSLHHCKRATHYLITPEHGLVFFWFEPKDIKIAQPLPYPMDRLTMIDFAANWLRDSADYGKQPNHDGDNSKGWRIYNEAWGHVAGSTYGIIGVRPIWAMHGK